MFHIELHKSVLILKGSTLYIDMIVGKWIYLLRVGMKYGESLVK